MDKYTRFLQCTCAMGGVPVLASHRGNALILAHRFRSGVIDGDGVSEVQYEDTDHYAVTRDFLNHYPRRLEQLFADDDD